MSTRDSRLQIKCFLCGGPARVTMTCAWCAAVRTPHPVAQHRLDGGSIRELAERIGAGERHLRALATGEASPSLELALRLARELGVRPDALDMATARARRGRTRGAS